MKRRDFSQLMLGCAGLAAAQGALAQAQPVEGQQFIRLAQPAPVAAPSGKIEVLEFFWYGCPHCNALEPTMEAWLKKLPADVAFRRVPVAFSAMHESHQRLYYTLEAMGQLDALHKKIFAAMHVQRQRLDKEAEQVAFVTANGVDGDKFVETSKSFSVLSKMRQARQLADAYKIDGVPAFGVQGRYFTAGSLTGSNESAVGVVDALIQKVRKGG